MSITLDRATLTRIISHAASVAPSKAPNPELVNVLIHVDMGRLTVTATDMRQALVQTVANAVDPTASWTFATPAGTLSSILRSMTGDNVSLSLANNGRRMVVEGGDARFNIVGTDGEDYPPVVVSAGDSAIAIHGGDLGQMIDETLFAVSGDDSREGLAGVHVETIERDGVTVLRMVATDGSRLSMSEAEYSGDAPELGQMLIPRAGLADLRRLLTGEDWGVSFGDRKATFSAPGLTYIITLVEGQFPDYRQVLPNKHSLSVILPRAGLVGALKRVGIMASDRNHTARFEFSADRLVLTASNVDAGDVREEVEAVVEGKPVSTGFNLRYFIDILSATSSDRVILDLGGELDPCLVRIPGREDCLFVVMPMRLD
jgi:DNA polymerase-3 subunit beta